MSFLKGNYKLRSKVKKKKITNDERLEELFEKNAKERLGGSMVFVSKKKINWDLE